MGFRVRQISRDIRIGLIRIYDDRAPGAPGNRAPTELIDLENLYRYCVIRVRRCDKQRPRYG